MKAIQGTPCWYELATSDLDAAQRFYEAVIGWRVAPSPNVAFDYRIAHSDDAGVAGLMTMPSEAGMPPFWMIYFAVDDADRTAAAAQAAGGRIYKAPADIPAVGRFAVLGDPQGAGFGILAPAQESPRGNIGAFDPMREKHGNWNELMSTDPSKAFDFYSALFGWQRSTEMDMGEMGKYQLLAHQGQDIGAVMELGDAPQPCWLPYFGTNGVTEAIERIGKAGGQVLHGPIEVPGGAFISVARDPQGAHFAVVGPLKRSG